MSKTVVLLNPMGADVTPFVNDTPGVPQLLRGTVTDAGDTLYTLPYTNAAGAANIAAGVTLLENKLNATTGQIFVFAYSEGCQVVYKWLRDHGATSSIDPVRLAFLLIGNSERKYGGLIAGHSAFSPIADTAGLPATVRYSVIDFVRQYDGWGDFPSAPAITAAVESLSGVGLDDNAFVGAMNAVSKLMANSAYSMALSNAIAGQALVHEWYIDVTPTDANVVTYIDPATPTVKYVWSPTYPVPLLGGLALPQSDQQMRTQIESAYSRPVVIPAPDYAGLGVAAPWGGVQHPPPVMGWWPELNVYAVGIPSAAAVGRPTISIGPHVVTVGGIPSDEAFGQATVSFGAVSLQVVSIPSGEAFGVATVLRGAVTIGPAGGIPSAEAFGLPSIMFLQTVTPTGIPSAEAVGTPSITVGAVTIAPTGIPSAEAFGAAVLTPVISPTGIPSAEAFGAATVTVVVIAITPAGIPSAEAFGAATITTLTTIAPTGIPSAEAFGAAALSTGPVTVAPAGIGTGQAFGVATITTGPVSLAPVGIASAEAFGAATVSTGPVSLTPTGIPSAEAFGAATLSTGPVNVAPTGIASGEAFGAAAVTTGAVTVAPTGIATAEAFGAATLTTGPVNVAAVGIASGEAFGTAVLTTGPVTITAVGIPSEEAFGQASVSGFKYHAPTRVVPYTARRRIGTYRGGG
jgi:hypothetical protein